MGTIVQFPEVQRPQVEEICANAKPASVVILPVVRIERHSDAPTDGATGDNNAAPGRRRRRRATRP